MQDEFGALGLIVVGIAVPGQSSDVLRSFQQEYAVTFRILQDNGLVAAVYGLIATHPFITIISREGAIVYQAEGFHSAEELRSLLLQVIN